jgi:HlyD family secretion protein
MPKKGKSIIKKIVIAIIILAIAAGVAIGVMIKKKSQENNLQNQASLFTVEKGHLLISITERGTIKPREQVILKSELEGRSTILKLVPEGTQVKKGELLVELDATSLQDKLIKQTITVDKADATKVKAQKDLEVGINLRKSDLLKANDTLKFALEDETQYTDPNGVYQNLLKQAETKILINKEERERAEEKYLSSKKLAEKKYISNIELKSDKLAWDKADLETELAKSDRDLLKDYTYHRQIAQLKSDITQAEMALERVELKSDADIVQFKAQLEAAKKIRLHENNLLEKIKQQISKAKIFAPSDGIVVHATSTKASWHRSNEPLDVGQEVHEHEELIHLPTAESVKSEISIHESNLNKVDVGMPAIITVDALGGKTFKGEITNIAVLPNAQLVFINPDLKMYITDVNIEGDTKGLRTGTSCKTQIIIAEYDDVTYVPVQCVVKIGDQHTVYVMENGKPKPTPVQIGLDNNIMIHIVSGLRPGQQVLMTPPLSHTQVKNGKGRKPQNRRPNASGPSGRRGDGTKPGNRGPKTSPSGGKH